MKLFNGEYIDMERGLRTLINPVDDAIVYGVEIKKGDMIWVSERNAIDVMEELDKFGCEFEASSNTDDSSLIGLFITKVPDEENK